jgi:hypothetical protein
MGFGMSRSAQQAAIEQANLLSTYLSVTPASNIDLRFIRRHIQELTAYAQEAYAAASSPTVSYEINAHIQESILKGN